jgi:hypothetical protein
MAEVLKWLSFAMQILPAVLQGVILAEQTAGAGQGVAKKAMVAGTMAPAIATLPEADQATATAIVSAAIDHTVAAKNASGAFVKPAAGSAK